MNYNIKIIGTGSYVPQKTISNKELEKTIPTNHDWIFSNLGIVERHIASDAECTSDLAAKAGINAIENAGLKPEQIDLIIVATATPDRLAPSTASIVQSKLKAKNAVAFDVSAVCSGFLYGMAIASQFLQSNTYKNILVIGADTFSKITNWSKRDAVFFGDGAGACVFCRNNSQNSLFSFKLYTDGSGKDNFTIPAGGSEIPASIESVNNGLHYFKMNGRAVYETAIKVLPKAIDYVLNESNIKIDDVAYMIPHQPSIQILKKTAEIIKLPWEKVQTNMDKYANTSGGTIPILLDEVNKKALLHKNDIILFAAVGSGWTYGAALLKWQ